MQIAGILNWVLTPIGLYSFLALSLIGSMALFLSMKREITVLRRSLKESVENSDAAAAASSARMAEDLAALRQEMAATAAALRQEITPPETTYAVGQELSLTRRTQALRMQRRGETPATIAAALRTPRNEIDLLLKIQDMSKEFSAH